VGFQRLIGHPDRQPTVPRRRREQSVDIGFLENPSYAGREPLGLERRAAAIVDVEGRARSEAGLGICDARRRHGERGARHHRQRGKLASLHRFRPVGFQKHDIMVRDLEPAARAHFPAGIVVDPGAGNPRGVEKNVPALENIHGAVQRVSLQKRRRAVNFGVRLCELGLPSRGATGREDRSSERKRKPMTHDGDAEQGRCQAGGSRKIDRMAVILGAQPFTV